MEENDEEIYDGHLHQDHQRKEREMSFLDHLEELRWHVIRALGAIVILAIGAFVFREPIWHYVILAPSRPNFGISQRFKSIVKMASKTPMTNTAL